MTYNTEKLRSFKERVAINKICEFSKMIKVHKVSASVQLNYLQVNQNVQQAIYRAAQLELIRSQDELSEDQKTKDNTESEVD